MAKQLDISAIHPNQNNWRAKVLVLEKANAVATGGEKRIQKMILSDEKGNKVQGILWNNSIELFRDSLHPFKTYIIGGAVVGKIKEEYLRNTPGITIQWTLSRSTYIRPVKDDESSINYPDLPFMSCSDMISTVATRGRVDIMAVVVDVKQVKEVDVDGKSALLQECTIIHEELQPIVLTLWGNFLDNQGLELLEKKENRPTILAKHLIPTTFSGLSLGTSGGSFIAVDPDILQAQKLRTWADENATQITNAMEKPNALNLQHLVVYNPEEPITPINDIVPDSKNPWVEIQLTIEKAHQEIAYTSCPGCMYSMTTALDEQFYCYTCKCMQPTVLKCKLIADATDKSGTIKVTLYDKMVEDMLKHGRAALYAMSNQDISALLEQTNESLQGKEFRAQIKAVKKKYKDKTTRYSIQQLDPQEMEGACVNKSTPAPTESNITEKGGSSNTESKNTDPPQAPPAGPQHSGKNPTEDPNENKATKGEELPSSPLKKMKIRTP